MDSTRQNKVSKLLQRELGDIFQREGREIITKAMITVTKVQVSKDLSYGKVYLSLFTSENKEKMLEVIRKHTGEVRYNLGKRIGKQVRVVPEIHFFLDDSLDYIENIEMLLDDDQ